MFENISINANLGENSPNLTEDLPEIKFASPPKV